MKKALVAAAMGGMETTSAGQVSAREAVELESAAAMCEAALRLLGNGGGLELVAEELRAAYEALGRAAGEGYAEEVLDGIFSRFCVGK